MLNERINEEKCLVFNAPARFNGNYGSKIRRTTLVASVAISTMDFGPYDSLYQNIKNCTVERKFRPDTVIVDRSNTYL